MSPAVVSGIFAIGVAILAAYLSYWFGKRTLAQQLTLRLKEIGATAQEDRITAERQYQLDAMKTFRATVGGPKGQIIESVHDLSDRLRQILRPEQNVDRWELLRKASGYQQLTAWLILRPFVWIDVLRARMVFLDQTLGELVEDEFRFLSYCRLLERALTERTLFDGADYKWPENAGVFYYQLRAITEQLRTTEGTDPVLISYLEFLRGKPSPEVQAVMELLRNAGGSDRLGELARARLIAIYAASNLFLEHFKLPYRQFEGADASVGHLDAISEGRRAPIRENLERLLSEHKHLTTEAA